VAFVTDVDVKGKYDRSGAEWAAIAAAASNAASSLSAAQKTQMGLLATRLQSMLADEPSFFRAASQSDTADALERDLWAFAGDLRSSGIPGVPAQSSTAPATMLDKLVDLVPLVVVGLVVLELAGKGRR
jgi:hypothetical protein